MMKVRNTPKLLLSCATLLFAVSVLLHAGDDATMPRWLKRRPVANPLGIDPMLLLQTDNIKAELKLTVEQSEKIQKLSSQAGETRLSTLNDEERAKKEQELRQAADEIMQAERADVEKILTAEQLDSFKRIMLRLSGSDA